MDLSSLVGASASRVPDSWWSLPAFAESVKLNHSGHPMSDTGWAHCESDLLWPPKVIRRTHGGRAQHPNACDNDNRPHSSSGCTPAAEPATACGSHACHITPQPTQPSPALVLRGPAGCFLCSGLGVEAAAHSAHGLEWEPILLRSPACVLLRPWPRVLTQVKSSMPSWSAWH